MGFASKSASSSGPSYAARCTRRSPSWWSVRSGAPTCSKPLPVLQGVTTVRTTTPAFVGGNRGGREWDDELAADPVEWLGRQLSDLDMLVRGEIEASEVDPDDARQLRETVPEILDVVRRLLAKVHAGELATAPEGYRADEPALARAGWL